jgi:hypothetical protein
MTFSAFGPIISTIGPIIIATPAIGTDTITATTDIIFPVQREMESGRCPLLSIPPLRAGIFKASWVSPSVRDSGVVLWFAWWTWPIRWRALSRCG